MKSRRPRRKVPRWIVIAGAGLLALAAAVSLGTQLLIRTGFLGRLLNEDPESLSAEWSAPRGWLPGRIGFSSLTLRSSDHNVQWEARLSDVEIRFSLLDLLRRRFHVEHVHAARLDFRLRERLRPDEVTPARLARYPRIAGFAAPPLLEKPPSSPVEGRPWRILVDDLAVEDVTGIWIDAWRWQGSARLRGGFELLPGREAKVLASGLDVVRGALRHGEAEVAEETRGAVWCDLPRFDTQAFPGNDVWKIVSGGASLRGRLGGLAFLSADGEGPRFSGGLGHWRFGVTLTEGAGRAHLTAAVHELRASAGARRLRGSARVELRVPRLDFGTFSASFDGSRVLLRDVGIDGPPAAAWSAELRAPAAGLEMKTGRLAGRVEGRFADARPIVALLPPGLPKWAAGLLNLSDLTFASSAAVAPGFLDITGAHVAAGTFELSGDYRARVKNRWGAFHVRSGSLSLGVGVDETGTKLHLAKAAAWFEAEARPGGLRSARRSPGARSGAAK